MDNFLVNIWTILDHTRTRVNLIIKAIQLNVWSIFTESQELGTLSRYHNSCLLDCPSPPKRLCDFIIINEIKEDGMME